MIIEKFIFGKHLEEGEKILYSVHKHWVEIFRSVIQVGFFGLVLPWGLYAMGFNTVLFFWLAIAWSVFAYIRFFYILIDWYCDVWLSTDMGLISVEWKGIFRNSATRIGYEDIEGVVYEINGFWGTVLGYGNLTLRVNSGNNILLKNAKKPKDAELALARLQSDFLNKKGMESSDGLKEILSQMVAQHMRNKK